MSVKTRLTEIRDQIAQLTPAEVAELQAWLETQMAAGEDQSEEITVEDLCTTLKGYEEHYDMSSGEFARRYDAHDPEILRFDHAGGWRAIYSLWEQMRDEAKRA